MQHADKVILEQILFATAGLYGRQAPNIDQVVLGMWFAALDRFSIDDVKTGFNRHIQNPDSGQYFPKPADIIRLLHGNSETQSGAAWTAVDKAIRTVGPYQNVVFDDPIIHAVIGDMGGWVSLCNTSGEDYPFRKNEFGKRYQGYVMNPPTEYPRMLSGIAQSSNCNRGVKHIDKPVVIGDIDHARLVYRGGSDGGKKIQRVGLEALESAVGAIKRLGGGQ